MDTHFAPPKRAEQELLKQQVTLASSNPIINGIMQSVSGLLAVLNEQRQIIALNQGILNMLGIEHSDQVMGLRLGETLQCVHAESMDTGCGTSEACASCGAAIAMVASLGENKPISKICSVAVNRKNQIEDLVFQVQSCPIVVEDHRFLLLFLQDITVQHKWHAIERSFFHDLNTTINGLMGTADSLLNNESLEPVQDIQLIHQLAMRLAAEVTIQAHLVGNGLGSYRPIISAVRPEQVIEEIRAGFSNHPAAKARVLLLPEVVPDILFNTDFSMLHRALSNMVLNALEAVKVGEIVTVGIDLFDKRLVFSVHNPGVIPQAIEKRIFQRNFSTKEGSGRGLGTYSMKLFGEQFLKGKVDFSSSMAEGTVFRLTLDI